MHVILAFCAIFLIASLGSSNGQQVPEIKREVKFLSHYDGILELFWVGSVAGGDGPQRSNPPVLIAELSQGVTSIVDTFEKHIFYAANKVDGIRAIPRRVVIDSATDLYEFKPEEWQWDTLHLANRNKDKQSHLSARSSKETPESKRRRRKRFDAMSPTSVAVGAPDRDLKAKAAKVTKATKVNRNRAPSVNNGLHPAVTLLHSGTKAMSAKFRSLVSEVDYYYDDGRDGIYQGRLKMGQETTTNTYEGHIFYFVRPDDKSHVLARFRMSSNQVLYVVRDEEDPAPKHLSAHTENELQFMREYKNRTGLHWRHFYGHEGPRGPPIFHMWDAEDVGQVHSITSEQSYWFNNCSQSATTSLFGSLVGTTQRECQKEGPLTLELEVISLQPRVFVIENFLSDFEADEIKRYAKDNLVESTVGNKDGGGIRKDLTRSSKNTWVSRTKSAITETLFKRAADVVKIPENLLHNTKLAEDMQVVHYVDGQKYDAHHDWGVSGYPESRYITLLMYLTDQPGKHSGGETAFPKAAGGGGIKVHPGKGAAVLFYNLLEDGNGDDLALHAALPVNDDHEKYLSNFWIWEPTRR